MLTKYRGVILGLAYADALGAGYEFFKGKIGEAVEFVQGKVEPFEGVGNHIVNPEDLPNPDWVVSDEYPRNTLREKCES